MALASSDSRWRDCDSSVCNLIKMFKIHSEALENEHKEKKIDQFLLTYNVLL